MAVEQQVQTYVVATFGRGTRQIGPDTSLLDSGFIDSTGILELVMFLETEFGIVVTDEEVVPTHFESVRAITAFVDAKRRA